MDAFSQAKAIVLKLVKAGHLAYFAGGWVRDYVMGHPSEDIDIATSATPAEIMNLFSNTLLVGLSFGVVIVVVGGHQFEVATFRKDLAYVDGRHPVGIELSNPKEDALRRDFTINGMFYDPLEEKIHDYVNGQEDIKLGVIRTIGDPEERFFEDRLRILRAFRFAARFSFVIDSVTQTAIMDNADKLFPSVALERVGQEFNKMKLYPRFDQAIVDMHRLSILEVIFPELTALHLNDLRKYVSSFAEFPPNCPTVIYLMELFPAMALEQKIEIGKRLKFTNKDVQRIEFWHALQAAIEKERLQNVLDLRNWTHLMAHADFSLALTVLLTRLSPLEREKYLENIQARMKNLELQILRVQTRTPLVSALYLQKKGIKPGKNMGLLLKEAEKISINENIQDPESVLDQLTQLTLWNDSL